MRPERLVMQNFGPFAGKETIDFTALDDIFLITGKTGSGKTTIFDALCFALYGKVPGSRGDHLSRLRSDYAGDETECLVSLEFSIGEKRYRVDRSPKQEKVKKRGTGMTTAEESAALYEIKAGNLINLNTKKTEADEKIQELIGLEAEEFFKIVLLPQGAFAEFLKQNTTKRKEVLGKLFPMEKAGRVQELAQEKAKQALFETHEAERALNEISKRISFSTKDDLQKQAEEAVRAAKAQSAALAEEDLRLRSRLAARQKEGDAAERLTAAAEAVSRNEALGEAVHEKEDRLARSRKAQPLTHYMIREEEKRREADNSTTALESALREKAAAEQASAEAESRAGEIAALEAELRELREKRPAIAEMLVEEEKLRQNNREAETLRQRIEETAGVTESLKKNLAEKEREIQHLEALSQKTEALDAQWERERNIKEQLLSLKKLAAEGETLQAEEKAAAQSIQTLEGECAELNRRIPVLTEELRRLRQEKENLEKAGLAAHLGAKLIPGEPCPVCGSREHPLPAAAPAPVFGINERIESQDNALKDAAGKLAAKNAEKESREQERQRTGRKIEVLLKTAAEVKAATVMPAVHGNTKTTGTAAAVTPVYEDPALAEFFGRVTVLPELGETSRLLEAQSARLNTITAERTEGLRAGGRLANLRREQADMQRLLTEQEKEHAAATEKHRGLTAAAEEMRRKHARLSGQPDHTAAPAKPAQHGELPAGTASTVAAASAIQPVSAAVLLKEIDRRIGEADGLIQQYREQREQAGRALAAAAAREESGKRQRDAAAAQYRDAAAEMQTALSSSPFPTAAALREAVLDSAAEAALEADIVRWKEERSRLQSVKTELLRVLEEVRQELEALGEVPSAAEISARLDALSLEQDAAETARDKANGELAALERDAVLLREANDRYESRSQTSRRLTALADDLNGRNPKKKSFEAWLLGRYLAEVAAFATRRLERMSEGRYSLLLDSSGDASRGRAGLDLAVFDAYTGKCRPCATLSGGESFMASISLALGLADSIQSRSGGVRLDAVFIDEGFGSLDEASLDRALVILDELRDHRMVGLISHVGEMSSRIPSRIDVIKSGSGSRIRVDSAACTQTR
ncbi:nuclease SbcCD subunit C [Spirochaetia bacterium]|nr:nuclease SbcCD subunit C [Spirochaetia bacterium]